MIRINLMAAERPSAQKKVKAPPGAIQAYLFLALFGGGALLACAGAYFYKSTAIARLDTDIKNAEEEARKLQAIKAQVDDLEKKRADFKRKVDLIEKLRDEQKGPVHMLDELSKGLPDFVWLNAMDQAGANLTLAGQSNSLTAVADFILALQRSGWFPTVDLGETRENNNIIDFSIRAAFQNKDVVAKQAAADAAAAKAKEAPASAPVQK